MKHEDILEAIHNLIPDAKFILSGVDYDNIEWVDERQKPAWSIIEQEIKNLPEKRALQQKTLSAQKQAILEKLGLSENEVRMLFQ